MEFLEDLITKFIKGLKYNPIELCKETTISGNEPVYHVWVNAIHCFRFEGFSKCSFVLATDKTCDIENYDRDWQDFVIENTQGKQNETLLNLYLNESKERLFETIRDFMDQDSRSGSGLSMQAGLENELEKNLELEESVFSKRLARAEKQEDFQELLTRSTNLKAEYGAKIYKSIEEFLDCFVDRGFNADGEAVYNFTQEQLDVYETVKGIKDDVEFVFNYEIYRIDQKELQTLQSEQ